MFLCVCLCVCVCVCVRVCVHVDKLIVYLEKPVGPSVEIGVRGRVGIATIEQLQFK